MSKEKEVGIKLNTATDVLGNPIPEFAELPDTEEFLISEQEVGEPLNDLTFEQARQVLSGAQGKVLTIIDATFIDGTRLKYVKDLIRDAFSAQANWLFELATGDFEKAPGTKNVVVENVTRK